METLSTLREKCLACTRCPLAATRQKVVFGVGQEDAKILFVGEGPGANEDATGEPFVGAAGNLLDRMLDAVGLSRAAIVEQGRITGGLRSISCCCQFG